MADYEDTGEIESHTSSAQLINIQRGSECLIPVNSRSPSESKVNQDEAGQPQGNNPEFRGSTSENKRSKRAPKPSSALLEAKRNAQAQALKKGVKESETQILIKDHLQPARDSRSKKRGETGVVYDHRMIEHKCLWDQGYPEKPDRYSVIIERCEQLGLLERCCKIPPRFAKEEEILHHHTQEHVDLLRKICKDAVSEEGLEEHSSNYDAIYFHPSTYDLALLAAGCTIDLIKNILDEKIQNGMAIVRPPGHHAMKEEFCGYCYFNNVALAAKWALDNNKAKKVLIVDFDVHHGQATQQMFYNDPRVLYFSTHRFENGKFWPNLEESNFHYIGSGNGLGFNVNIPLNEIGLANAEFLSIWHQILLPVAYQFNPDLVIVSAGYDAALGCFEFNPDIVLVSAGFDSAMGDDKGEMELTPQCYPHLIWPLMNLANGKIAVILEGGYCLKSLAEGAALTLRTLLHDPCPLIPSIKSPSVSVVESILNATYMLKPFWSHLIGEKVVKKKDPNKNFDDSVEPHGVYMPQVEFEWNEPKQNKFLTRNCYPIQSRETWQALDERLDRLILNTNLNMNRARVGLLYDDLMLKHRNVTEPGHPERPDRISNIFACHGDFGLVERCVRVSSRVATENELLLVHTKEHIDNMSHTRNMSKGELEKLKGNFNSVFFNSDSYQTALVSAGSVLQVVDSVMNGQTQSGVAIVRPPGHHAEEDEPCGFCIFNNVAVAAKYALEAHGLNRILIVDWDVHHGNGIQRMFQDDPRVLYFSIHRFDDGSFFPCSEDANYHFVGKGRGEGFNVNVPWNRRGMGDTEYLAVFTNILLPIAYEYNPELVLVSAGFDAAKGDPLGGCELTPEGYGHMTRLLMGLANGKMVVALEGGYNLISIAYSMVLCTKALLGDPLPPLSLKDEISSSALTSIHNVLKTHSKYWTTIKSFRKMFPSLGLIQSGFYERKGESQSKGGDKLHEYLDNTPDELEKLMVNLDLDSSNKSELTSTSFESSSPDDFYSEKLPDCPDLRPTTHGEAS